MEMSEPATTSSPEAKLRGSGKKPGLDMKAIDESMTFFPSERCTVSCGTVCIDPVAAKVLVILNKRLRIYQLPKGRKNIGEDLRAAAFRETFEETGVRAVPLPLKIATRATKPRAAAPETTTGGEKRTHHGSANGTATSADGEAPRAGPTPPPRLTDPDLTEGLDNLEFVGMIQYPDPQAVTPRTEKTVFYFAATADSRAPLQPNSQDQHEDLEPRWVEVDCAAGLLRFKAEGDAVWKVVGDLERTGIRHGIVHGG